MDLHHLFTSCPVIVGGVSARITKVSVMSHALKMALLGGVAILIGVIVGKFIKAG